MTQSKDYALIHEEPVNPAAAEIPKELTRLQEGLESLSSRLETLADCLSPVLRDLEPDVFDTPCLPKELHTTTGRLIRVLAGKVENEANTIQSLINRLGL